MKGIAFYAEMPDSWGSKKACKSHGPWTRKDIKALANAGGLGNVVAVLLGLDHACPTSGNRECLSAVFCRGNSDVNLNQVSPHYLSKRTTRIDEATARKLHPRLFERLDFD